MYQGKISWPWLALVLVLFCVPPFVGLGREDIHDDEAIYSFAVDLILETGDWLQPRAIPNEAFPFLEKPPLKFWIVAAPIKLGLLPHDEFGLRVWDALFGAVSFMYVFLIGSRLLGPVCGLISVLILFAHEPLLFLHGLRGNNMDAPLVVAYCGGVYHFMAWARSVAVRLKPDATGIRAGSAFRRNWPAILHAFAVGLYFVLGFMTKFVAVLFLPIILGAAVLLVPEYRRKVLGEWRVWAGVAALVLALIAPWFVWASRRYDGLFWKQIFGDAVITRMTSYLDPLHVHPWYFYAVSLHGWLSGSGTFWLVVVGLLVLGIQAVKRRWPEAVLLLLWGLLPLVVISFGTSKLYHYTYPFLPPLALAAGYLASLALAVAPAPVNRVLQRVKPPGPFRPRVVRAGFLLIAIIGVILAIVAVLTGPILIASGSRELFKNSGILRPLVVAVVFGLLGGVGWRSPRAVVAMLVLSTLPIPTYRECLVQLTASRHPMRTARDCVRQVQGNAHLAPGMYVDVPPQRLPYPHYYYFRRVRPWIRAEAPAPERLRPYLIDPIEQRPVLIWQPTYAQFRQIADPNGTSTTPIPEVAFLNAADVLLLLPGRYGVCKEAVAAHLAN